jgi:hypothetical protein
MGKNKKYGDKGCPSSSWKKRSNWAVSLAPFAPAAIPKGDLSNLSDRGTVVVGMQPPGSCHRPSSSSTFPSITLMSFWTWRMFLEAASLLMRILCHHGSYDTNVFPNLLHCLRFVWFDSSGWSNPFFFVSADGVAEKSPAAPNADPGIELCGRAGNGQGTMAFSLGA